MENFFNNKSLFLLVNKWKRHILIVVVSATVLGAFISSPIIITPLFKSSAVLYPVNLPEISKESKTEQMMQIIKSTDISRKLITSLHLGQHYKIDSASEFYSNVMYELSSNLTISKTEYEGVEIVSTDKDPVFASMLIDSLIKFYNGKVETMHKAKNLEMVLIRGGELKKKQAEIDSLETLMKGLRTKYGIIDYGAQAKELTRGYVNLLASGKGAGSRQVDTLINNLKMKGGDALLLNSLLIIAQKQFEFIKDDYEKNLSEVNKKITYAHLVSTPFPADKKSYPIRWLIVLGFAVSSLIISFIGIAFIESRKQ